MKPMLWIVNTCRECPAHSPKGNGRHFPYCYCAERLLTLNGNGFPSWCPLRKHQPGRKATGVLERRTPQSAPVGSAAR